MVKLVKEKEAQNKERKIYIWKKGVERGVPKKEQNWEIGGLNAEGKH